MVETIKRKTRGGWKLKRRSKTRRAGSFFGLLNSRQQSESESNKTAAVVAALAVVPLNDSPNPFDDGVDSYGADGGWFRRSRSRSRKNRSRSRSRKQKQ